MKKCLSRAHCLEVANGPDQENFIYCSKQDDYKKRGEKLKAQGKRKDVKEVANLIKTGEITLTEIMFDYPDLYLKYSKSFEKMFNTVQPIRKKKEKKSTNSKG